MILKLDIRQFFDHVTYALVKNKVFTEDRFSDANRILLSILCTYDEALPQGAPTSPMISNILLKDFDEMIGEWCREKKIVYTRYCDDMTFSGDPFDEKEVIDKIMLRFVKVKFHLTEQSFCS